MTEVDWDDAGRQWERLVKEQEAPTPKKEPSPSGRSITATGLCIAFFSAWFIRTMVLSDLMNIALAVGTLVFFIATGTAKESPEDGNTNS